MIERRGRARFLGKALQAVAIRRKRGGQHFDGYRAVQPGIVRPVHFAHAARTHDGLDFVRPEFRAGGQWHGSPRLYLYRVFSRGRASSKMGLDFVGRRDGQQYRVTRQQSVQ